MPKLGVQLHSVRDAVSDDFEATLTELAKMGFTGVEFAGRYGPYKDDPQGLKSFLDSLNLQVSGAHMPLSQLQGKVGERNFVFLKQLGAGLVIVPFDNRANDPSQIDALIAELASAHEQAKQHGLRLGYHNHSQEFETFKGATFWDYIAKQTPSDFALQLDVGWVNFTNMDAIDFVKRYPKRTLSTHYKVRTYKGRPSTVPQGTKVIIGEDNYHWRAMVQANVNYGGTQWIIIEQEEYPEGLSPLQSVQASLAGMKSIMDEVLKEQTSALR
ncbi:sugar phosphate isomerase/epimerase family protein [Ningiella sp. W23]|uniref:sugar phosphate isomerase/epimerase family protein n=1 Tax=Ningiella sp. W23 TaxID=3023715 RepID=UPI0037583182